MAEVRLTEDGRLVNAETGEEFGKNIGGRIVLDSTGAEAMTLEETGFREPDETAEEYYDELQGDGIETGKTEYDHPELIEQAKAGKLKRGAAGKDVEPARKAGKEDAPGDGASGSGGGRPGDQPAHMDSGPSSFDVKRTKYEVTPETYFVVRFGIAEREDGGVFVVNENAAKDSKGVETHWAKFRMWTYGEELKWKAECMEFNQQSKAQFINNDRLNEIKLKRLLLDWSFGEREDRLRLLHCDGRLSDESYSIFCGLYPAIAGGIVNLMNSVLEA